jgi:hypothetical protein
LVVGFVVAFGSAPASAGIELQACCKHVGECINFPPEFCPGTPLGPNTTCAADGALCNIPTVGEWGLVILTLSIVIVSTLILDRNRVRGRGAADGVCHCS